LIISLTAGQLFLLTIITLTAGKQYLLTIIPLSAGQQYLLTIIPLSAGQLYQLVLTHGTIIRENENIRRQTRRIEVSSQMWLGRTLTVAEFILLCELFQLSVIVVYG
jgi:hypothetical protein